MQGVITGREVVLHPITIVRVWGLAAWLCCLWATITRRRTTFLGLLYGGARPTPALAPADVARPARPGAVVLAAAVEQSPRSHLVLACAPGACSRWRPSR